MTRPLLKASALRPGDTVGIVSPAWFGGATFVPRARRGIAALEGMGFRVVVAPHAFANAGHVSASAAERASDLHAMFADTAVRAILATIGGDHANQVLPLLDWDLIAANPKVFLGFSDITVLNMALYVKTGLVTFNGPSLLTDWAEFPAMPEESREQALRAICRPLPMGDLAPFPWWTEEFLDWEAGEDTIRERIRQDSTGWRWLRPGRAEGRLLGGCLESLQHLRGTPYWPDVDGAILFLETSEVRPTPEDMDALLMDFENMGVFDGITGLVVARPYGYAPEDVARLDDVIVERVRAWSFPVLAGADVGHTTPLQTLPMGCRALLDAEAGRFSILEAAVCAPESGDAAEAP